MENSNNNFIQSSDRRRRIHELLIALISQQGEIELMDADAPRMDQLNPGSEGFQDPARWLDRNRRILRNYQGLIRSAITLDALLDAEHNDND